MCGVVSEIRKEHHMTQQDSPHVRGCIYTI